MAVAPLTGAKRLRQLLADPNKLVVAPGVFDGFTARLALAAGFDALYMVWSTDPSLNLILITLRQEQEPQYQN